MPGRRSQVEVVEQLLQLMEEKLGAKEVKVTLADYVRLVQLRRDLEEEEPREIKVSWVERETPGEDRD